MKPYFYPAKLVSYNPTERTAMIQMDGLTDGSDGIKATLAYPIGDDDLDTERELLPGADKLTCSLSKATYTPRSLPFIAVMAKAAPSPTHAASVRKISNY